MKKEKFTECVPTHLSSGTARALKCIASDAGLSASEYVRRLIETDLLQKEVQAKATLAALGLLQNEENDEIYTMKNA